MTLNRLALVLCQALVMFWFVPARADFSFTYNGHSYTLVSTARTWANAQADAVARNGTLARIDDAAENNAILTNLLGKGITSTASDGGGSIYVWIGGKETVEGTYGWIDRSSNTTVFWAGGMNGSAQDGLYANWGRNGTSSGGPEPDNYAGSQNRTGFALEGWPKSASTKIGQAGQWNDIKDTDTLAYLVEKAPPSPPTNVHVQATAAATVRLVWIDTADNEGGFLIAYRVGTSGSYYPLGPTLAANTTNSSEFPGAAEGTTYQFFIRATNTVGVADSELITVTMPGITSRSYQQGVVGTAFSYTLTAASDAETPDAVSLTGSLPTGLSYNTNTHQLSGMVGQAGVFNLTMSARYPKWGTVSGPLTLRVIYPPGAPVVSQPVPKQILAQGGPAVKVALNQHFKDSDTEKAARLSTIKGDIDLALYATATPQTVSNFLSYVNRGSYSNSIVHRSVAGFVIQGGGYKPAPPNFTKIPTDPSPTNEPGLQNIRGTVAMAKLSGDANSATCQWFVNLADNTSNLDNQNGGFTAFARVCGNGMGVVDAIAALPRGTYSVSVDGTTQSFSDWPMDASPSAPATMDQSKLVVLRWASALEPLSYSIVGATVTGLVTAAVEGTNLVLAPVSGMGGKTDLTVRATDLDGQTVDGVVTVEVDTAYNRWLTAAGLQGTNSYPAADPEGDGVPNGLEFALGGAPLTSDRAVTRPLASVVTVPPQQSYGALTFSLRKDLSGAMVNLQTSVSLDTNAWSTVWTSTNLTSLQVMQRADQDPFWRLTVRDATPVGPGDSQRFYRLSLTLPP